MYARMIGARIAWLVAIFGALLPACGNPAGSGGNDAGVVVDAAVAIGPRADPTDYDARRIPIRDEYARDVPGYWATAGLPPLARLAGQLENLGQDPSVP